jgi:hypothetical protein
MTIASERLLVPAQTTRRRASFAVLLDRQSVFSWLMMALPLAFLAALVPSFTASCSVWKTGRLRMPAPLSG